MEGIFETVLQGIVEIVLEIVGEAVRGIIETIFTGDSLTYSNNNLPESNSVSREIITLDIQGYQKENV